MICNQTQDRFDKQQFWQEVHGIVLSIIWLLVADILLLVVKYWKSWPKYLLVHSIFGLFNLFTIFAIVIVIVYDSNYLFNTCFWQMKTSAQAHFIIGIIFLAMLLAVQTVGFLSKIGI
jgi:signal transduction histidine kinase